MQSNSSLQHRQNPPLNKGGEVCYERPRSLQHNANPPLNKGAIVTESKINLQHTANDKVQSLAKNKNNKKEK